MFRPVVLTDHLKKLLACLEKGAGSGVQAETGATDKAEMLLSWVDNLVGSEMKSQ